MNAAPKFERRADGNGSIPVLNFDQKAADVTARRVVYSFNHTIRDANPSDQVLRAGFRVWYDKMISMYYGNVSTLPNQKPDENGRTDSLI
jgi:hypothetical protein